MLCRLTLLLPLAALAQSPSAHVTAFQRDVEPLLATKCVMCHNSKVKNADLDLARLRNPAEALAERNAWEDVIDKVRNGEMPPPGMPRPRQEEMLALAKWIDRQVVRHDAAAKPEPGRVTARRLNKAEYDNTIRDLLGIALQPADDFPDDDSGYGFDNIGDVLSLSPVLMEKYFTAAENISRLTIVTGKPGRPTLRRYPSDKAEPDPVPGGIAVSHRFPAWAEYEIHVRAIDRRRGEGPPLRMALLVDGKQVHAGEFPLILNGPNKLIRHTMAVAPGDHTLRGIFLDASGQPVSGADPAFARKSSGGISARDIFVDYIEVRGPIVNESLGLPPAHMRVMTCQHKTAACTKKIVAGLLPRAWRRDVTPAEIAKIAGFADAAMHDGQSLEQAIRYSLQAMLVSPHFLFRIEPASSGKIEPVGDFELASRLSYFLWSSMPDAALFEAARSHALRRPEGLRAQVRRMLHDAKAGALIDNFAGQWLQLRNLESHKPDPEKLPVFDAELRAAMEMETRLFFEHIVQEDRPVLEFLDSNYTFLNERLAAHYGIEGISGPEFRKVELPESSRGGVLTHASILTISSYPTRTSPVLRGKWILENLLGTPPPPPPAGIPELNEAEVGNTGTLRQQLEAHRANPSCAVCHNKMDALGFGLENFDPIGRWRTLDGKFPIEAGGELPGGKTFTTPGEMRAILKADPKNFTRSLTEKLLTYALGRGLEKYDRPTVSKICNKLKAEDYRFSSLVFAIVESLPFRYRK